MAKAVAKTAKAAEPADERSDFPLLTYLDQLVDELREHVPAALKSFDTDAIHDARVSTRRLKSALDMLEPVLSKGSRKPFARVLRKLRRRLGPLRDQDVMLEHLGELAANSRYEPAARWLASHLEQERLAAREEAKEKSGPASVLGKVGSWWGLREEVAEASEAADSLLAESLHLQLDAFIEQADLISAMQRRGGSPAKSDEALPPSGAEPSNPHELRIAGKALRYTLEMAKEQGHALPADVAKSFKKMQESLGMWHDYVVLTEKAMEVSTATMLAHHDAAAQEAVLELARVTMQRAAKELQKFAALWASRGEGLARTIRSAFPLTPSLQEAQKAAAREPASATSDEPAVAGAGPESTGSKTGPDPSGSGPSEAPADSARGATSAA